MLDLPIKLVDFDGIDRSRIRDAMEQLLVGSTAEQVESIRLRITPLPLDDFKLVCEVAKCVYVDWDESPERRDVTLKGLRANYLRATHTNKKVISIQMLVATRGLEAHPDWWDMPCECGECQGYAD